MAHMNLTPVFRPPAPQCTHINFTIDDPTLRYYMSISNSCKLLRTQKKSRIANFSHKAIEVKLELLHKIV
jgi:hypothetical protein